MTLTGRQPACGTIAASFNHLRTRHGAFARGPPAPLRAQPTAPRAALGEGLALGSLAIGPAAAHAAAQAAGSSLPAAISPGSPIVFLGSGIASLLLVWMAVRTFFRRIRTQREALVSAAPAELLTLPVSELAKFDELRAEGDQRKIELAWRELVARKRGERERRLADEAAKRKVEPLDAAAGWTAVKEAAAEVNQLMCYLNNRFTGLEPVAEDIRHPAAHPARIAQAKAAAADRDLHQHPAMARARKEQQLSTTPARAGVLASGMATTRSPIAPGAGSRAVNMRVASERAAALTSDPPSPQPGAELEAAGAALANADADIQSSVPAPYVRAEVVRAPNATAEFFYVMRAIGALIFAVAKIPFVVVAAFVTGFVQPLPHQVTWTGDTLAVGSTANDLSTAADSVDEQPAPPQPDTITQSWEMLASKNSQLNDLMAHRRNVAHHGQPATGPHISGFVAQ